jgi:hypothetical protein
MNATFLTLLMNAPGVVSWLLAEKPKVEVLIADAEALIADLKSKGSPAASAQATGGLDLIGRLLSHAASTFKPPAPPA